MGYLILAALGLGSAAWLLWRRRDGALLATWFVAATVIDMADWVAMGWFEWYLFRPAFLAEPHNDSTIGILLTDLGFVPAVALFREVYLPGWTGLAAATGLVTLVEWAFVQLGLFTHHGWQYGYTLVAFPLYFFLVHVFRRAGELGVRTGWRRLGFRAAASHVFIAPFTALLKMTGAAVAHVHVFPTFWRNQSLGLAVTLAGYAVALSVWVLAGGPGRFWPRAVLAAAATVAIEYGLVWTGVRGYGGGWNPVWLAGALTGAICAAALADRWVEAWTRQRSSG